MKNDRWVHPTDQCYIEPVKDAVFDRGDLCLAGTNLRVGDVAARFVAGETTQDLADDMDLPIAQVEAAIRTALRARRHWP